MKYFKIILLMFIATFSLNTQASFNVYDFDSDVTKEVRFQKLISDLRCPKCQNNNLADSNAPLATDIKNYVYKEIKKGKTDKEITDFLISRYGLFIIYDPHLIFLWLIPFLIVLIGIVGFIFKKRNQAVKKKNLFTNDKKVTMQDLIQEWEQEQGDKK